MTSAELNRSQLDELKSRYFWDDCEEAQSWYSIPDEIPDFVVIDWYAGIAFTPDDFFCTAAQPKTLRLYTITGPVTYSEQWLTAEEAADPYYKEHGLTVTPKHEKQEAEQ